MYVRELIDMLECIQENYDDDIKVRLAQQPAWPFEYRLDQVVVTGGENPTVYIGEGEQLGYLSQEVRDELGW